jgi:hypothetical protein
MREQIYWDCELDLRNVKIKKRYFEGKTKNHCHAMIKEVRKHRIGDRFYLSDGNKIVRHRVDVVGTWKVSRTPKLKKGE